MAARKELPRAVQALLSGAVVAAVVLLLRLAPAAKLLELKARDIRMQLTKPAKGPETSFDHPEIGIILVTDDSIQWMEEESRRPWPWPREVFGFLFRACAKGNAKAILFDFFTHIDKDSLGTEAEWAKDIRNSPPSYLAVPFSEAVVKRADARKDLDTLLQKYRISVQNDGSVMPPDIYASVLLPQPLVAEAVTGVCDVHSPRDDDKIIRKYRLLSRFRGNYYPSFALVGLMTREKANTVEIRDGVMTIGRLSFPVDREGQITLRYYERFNAMPASSVITGLWSLEDEKKVTSFDPKRVEGRIMLIGTTAAALFDFKASPVGEIPGIDVHATAIRNLLDHEFLREVPVSVSVLLILVLALGTALGTRFTSAALGGSLAVGLLCGYSGIAIFMFAHHWIVDWIAPLLAIAFAYAATSALNYLYEGRQKQRVKRDFQRYFSPLVVEKILKTPDALSLEGERKMLTIFFMDFAGFTAMSEKLDPSELVTLMNEYHNEAAEEIFRTEGTIDKYIGDAIMAFWNDPIAQEDHQLRACLTAVGTQKRLKAMALVMRERGMPEMRARIGINSGIATVGNFGARRQVNYTLIGDEVNLASRIEGVNKEFGTETIVTEATYAPAKGRVEARELALIKVKGKKLPVRIYELIGLQGEVPPERLETARKFEAALEEFRARRFNRAWELFLSLSQKGDPPSEVYVGLCERFLTEPPPEDWDGSYQMEHK